MKKVLYIQPIHPAGMDMLREKYNVVVANTEDRKILFQEIADASAVITRLTDIDSELIEAAPHLEAIAKNGIGVDNIDVETASKRKIAVLTTGNANTASVAESIIFAMGALFKRTIFLNQAMHTGNWKCRDEGGFYDVMGRTFGVVGLGRIGAQVARIAKEGFQMNVLVYDAFLPRTAIEAMGYSCAENMDELCRNADVISLHMPLTKENTHIINEHTLSLMKPTAFVLNFSRGLMVDEDALYHALKQKKIAAAALDAFSPEPPDFSHPLYSLDNVLLFPHTAGISDDARKRMSIQVSKGIDDVLSGRVPECCANKEAVFGISSS